MSDRAALALHTEADRQKAAQWCLRAPPGTRVEWKRARRSIPQNSLMWSLLTDVSKQVEHGGRKYGPEAWKDLFMHALGRELKFLPSLDGQGFVPIGYRSSDLSKGEMTDLIELILSWGAEHGVTFHDERKLEAA